MERESLELFEKVIRPTLLDQCIRCHGPEKQKGGLRLDSQDGWKTGGDSGEAVLPGDLDSLLLEVIRYEGGMDMPPKGKLPDSTISAFEEWVKLGAFDPRRTSVSNSAPVTVTDPNPVDTSFWSFQPLAAPEVPKVVDHDHWTSTSLDFFILDQLNKEELTPSSRADRVTLIRRLHYDLTGLPPSVESIKDFVGDPDPDAWSKLVDHLLDQPEFGERWGRHWLDVVRFAESSGGGRTLLFPDAWRYRDYVIDAFNSDTPYDQFVTEQIAGDLLSSENHLERQKQIIATGFLLLGPTNYEMQDKDILEMDVVDEQLDTIGKSLMGMTIGCARCHDHKFDPIPTADYYALAGIFKSTHSLVHSNVSSWNKVPLPLDREQEKLIAEQESKLAEVGQQLQDLKKQLSTLEDDPKTIKPVDKESINGIVIDDDQAVRNGDWIESTSIPGYVGKQYLHDENRDLGRKSVSFLDKSGAVGSYTVYLSYTPGANRSTKVHVAIRHADGETVKIVNQRPKPRIQGSFHELGTFTFDELHSAEITISNQPGQDGVVIADAVILASAKQTLEETFPDATPKKTPEEKAQIESLKAQITSLEQTSKQLESSRIKRPVAMAVADIKSPCDISIAIRGVVSNQGEVVERDVLSAAKWEPFPTIKSQQSGRREFAKWVTDPKHPLTARVMVNRIWYWMMGRGLVRSLDNFGSTGEEPTHPELLDYLASQFVAEGWSVKQLIKAIALSSTYQQSSKNSPSTGLDPENHFYHRANRKRLRAEDLRDTLLQMGGNLDLTRGGPSIKAGTKIEYGYQFESTRRSVYLPIFRNTLPEVFEVFDFADPNIQQGKRNESTVASQALWLMNHPMILQQTEKAAGRLLAANGTNEEKIELAFLETLGRLPTKIEFEITEQLLSLSAESHSNPKNEPPAANDEMLDRWTMVYQTLCQSVDFLYVN